MKILFKFPIKYRKSKLFSTLDTYYKNVKSDNFEFIITIDSDDTELNTPEIFTKLNTYPRLKYFVGKNETKIQACNANIPVDGWDILVLVSDDMIPVVPGFDNIIREKMKTHYPDLDGVIWFNDGRQRDVINTLSIIGRTYYNRFGYVYHPDYNTMCCDREFTQVAHILGKQKYFDQVIIEHRHINYTGETPDKLHAKNMNDDLYEKDKITLKRREAKNFGLDIDSIPHVANFYWNTETPLSYLRYLTLKTFRYHHPDWVMKLWVSGSDVNNIWAGKREKQDFQNIEVRKNYLLDSLNLGVNILQFYTGTPIKLAPNYISDLCRFKSIMTGGWFFDLDQIFVRSFDNLCANDFVTGRHAMIYCGVIGNSTKGKVAKTVYGNQLQYIKNTNGKFKGYCDLGNHFLHYQFDSKAIKDISKTERHLITPHEVFYPIHTSDDTPAIYNGKLKIPYSENNYAVHWFGGHQFSQEFNKKYTPQFAKTSNDSISVYCRKIDIL